MKQEYFTPARFQRRAGILASSAILLGFFCLNSVCATEVYTWKDENGVSHFSDVPPESGESQQIEVEGAYMPGSADAYAADEDPTSNASAESSDAATQSTESRAQQMRDQMAKQRQQRKESQSENEAACEQSRKLLAQLEPARRVYYTDENGEQARMDDDQRVGMIQEAKDFIAKNCK